MILQVCLYIFTMKDSFLQLAGYFYMDVVIFMKYLMNTKSGTYSCRLLQNNAISGPIPAEIGKLEKLQMLDLSNNQFRGTIPSSLGDLKNLNYLYDLYNIHSLWFLKNKIYITPSIFWI